MAEKTPRKRTSAATCVCCTCNGNIISKNHLLDLFGEKAVKKEIGWDLEIFSGIKISLDADFPSRICKTCYLKVTKFQELVKMVLSKAQQESIIQSKRGKTVQESPSSTTSPSVGREKERSKVSWLELMLHRIFFIN